MADRRAWMTPKRKPSWRIDHQAVSRLGYALYETAWADAWPHVDDWFKTGAIFLGQVRGRPGIV